MTARRALVVLLALGLAVPARAGGMGWRHDGTGRVPDARPPERWAPDQGVLWRTPLPDWGNASPVLVDGRVCAAVEPTTLFCADAATGRILWQAASEVVDTLPPEQQAALRPELARADALEAELGELRSAYSLARRQARGGGDVVAELQRIGERMGEVRATLDALAPYRTPPADAVIGYASATPVTDGASLYAFFANGVVSRFEPDGTRTWSRWLGPHRRQLRGYLGLPAASPRLAGGVLVVGYNDLLGLDPATGETVWKVEGFADYGTPAVADVGGLEVVLTGDGRMVRARDGALLARDLADLWYIGPVVDGDRVYYAGTTAREGDGGASWPTWARAIRLRREGDRVTAEQLWDVQLPSRDRHYATPLVRGDALLTVARNGDTAVLDTATGAVRQTTRLTSPVPAEVWASPMEVGGRVLVMFDQGHVLTLGEELEVVQTSWLERGLASPVFSGGRVFVRGRGHLFGVGR